jgi:hypothetical protein
MVKAVIQSPAKGSTLTSNSATFTWTAETGATSYQLSVGSAAGLKDIASITTSSLSAAVSNLPTNGSLIYVTLNGYAAGVWAVQDTASYTAATIAKAVIVSPAKGSLLHGNTATFTWTAATGASAYQLWVGTTPGVRDIGSVGTTSKLSATFTNLPTNGTTIYVTLWANVNGVWVTDTATYTTGP